MLIKWPQVIKEVNRKPLFVFKSYGDVMAGKLYPRYSLDGSTKGFAGDKFLVLSSRVALQFET